MEDGVDFVVAIVYPIHEMIPSTPPTIIRTVSCITIGLHSDSISRYAYTKNPPMQAANIRIPVALRLVKQDKIQ